MKHHMIAGGGGTRLHLLETGNPKGQAILFLHGLSQCSLTWDRQLNSDLASRFRLVAMDLRGHGMSDKPREGYDNSRLWADDIDAAIRELDLEHPVLCGWSYGPLVMLDYVRHHGEETLGGMHFVAGMSKLGSDEASSLIAPEFLALVPGFFSADVVESVQSLETLLRLCMARELGQTDLYTMLGFCVSVPPFVRQALLSRVVDNDDLLPGITKPVLITHGAKDAIVSEAVVEQHRSLLRNVQIHIMPDAGHAAFWDDAPAFNSRLASFCDDISRTAKSRSAANVLTAR